MNNRNNIVRISLVVLFLSTWVISLQAQEITTSLELKSLKASDDSRIYNVTLTGESEQGTLPVYEAKVEFFAVADGKTELLGNAVTDREGKATLKLDKGTRYLANNEGINEVKASFTGKGQLAGAEATVKFREMNLSVVMTESDSLNTIKLQATSVGPKGEAIPLKETNFNLYVQGLFTRLKVGECFVTDGEGTFDFPRDIPGDVNGNLQIFVRLEENEEYGEIEKIENAKWGNHRSGFTEPERSLWSSGAPIWMITTLIILLAGVWSHYLYAVIQMIKIRKEGKKLEQN